MAEVNGLEGVWVIYVDSGGYPTIEMAHEDIQQAVMLHAALGYGKLGFLPFGIEVAAAMDSWERLVNRTDLGPGNVGRMYEQAMEAFKALIGFQESNPPEENPYLPKAPEDGQHIFDTSGGRSYRCTRCGVYDRPDVPSTKEILDKPCEGGWAQSGKYRAAAEEQWKAEKLAR